jgi:3D (Asp-Asp-Asp) domain-containing protein
MTEIMNQRIVGGPHLPSRRIISLTTGGNKMGFLMIALFLGSFHVTSYQAIPAQTRPHGYRWTASGERVNCHGIAVSQDLLKINGGTLSFGDMVYVEDVGVKFVNDTMNKRIHRSFDVLVGSLEEEKAFDKKFRHRKLRIWVLKIPEEFIK